MPSPSKSKSKSSSPKKGKSPKRSPDKGKPVESEVDYVYEKPPPSPPPPDPPKPTLLSQLKRQVWYPYANHVSFEHSLWFWSPFCPVITSWGELWLSDPVLRRIIRFSLDPINSKIKFIDTPLITKGEPRMIIEIPRTGRIAALLTCPKARKTTLTLYDPINLKEDKLIEFPYTVMSLSDNATLNDKNSTSEERNYNLIDESTPIGICANSEILFVLFHPLQRLKVYNAISLKPFNCSLENAFPDERSCIHIATSGGCAVTEELLFVAATRPPRVQVFWIHPSKALGRIDTVHIVWYAEFGLDQLSSGEPFCIQVDSLGLMVVSDSKVGILHVYNVNKRAPGPWYPSLPTGETCYLGSWKVDPYKHVRPGYFSLAKNGTACVVDRWSNKIHIIADRSVLRWYDDTYLVLGDVPVLRSVVDPMMPNKGLPMLPKPQPIGIKLTRRTSDLSEPFKDDNLLPPSWNEKFRRKKKEDLDEQEVVPKNKSPKGKKSPTSKNKSPNKDSKSPNKKGSKSPSSSKSNKNKK